jgi:hypothetical protein
VGEEAAGRMSRVPLWALMILLVAIEVNPDSRVLVVALGAILITGGSSVASLSAATPGQEPQHQLIHEIPRPVTACDFCAGQRINAQEGLSVQALLNPTH